MSCERFIEFREKVYIFRNRKDYKVDFAHLEDYWKLLDSYMVPIQILSGIRANLGQLHINRQAEHSEKEQTSTRATPKPSRRLSGDDFSK